MGALVIEFGGKPAGKKKGLADTAVADFMKEKGKGGGEAPAEEETSASQGAGEEAAQDFIDATKAGNAKDVYAAFCRMAEAHAHGDEGMAEEESDSEDDYED